MNNRGDFQQHIRHYGKRLRHFLSAKYVQQLSTSKKKKKLDYIAYFSNLPQAAAL
jgi:hypothetical protein